ncbi:MAG TPA: DUF1579 family protein [Chthoniobacterales bacterium]|nr:DUF1579 family protein [Chthoniobacterales bacterium]
MKKPTFSLLFLLLLLSKPATAQPPPSLQDPFLDNFVGDWKVERKIRNKRVVESSVRCEWVLNHQFIEFHYGAADAKPEYEAFVFIGFDISAKNYVCHWVDVFGATYSAIGNGKVDPPLPKGAGAAGDTWRSIEFRFLPKDGDLTNKFTFDPQTKTWASLIRQTERGEWITFAEEKWTKK